jgi:hypothetical protein
MLLSMYENSKLEYLFYNPKDLNPIIDARENLRILEDMVTEDKILNTLRDLCYTPPDNGPRYDRSLFKSFWVTSYNYGLDKVVKDYLLGSGKLHENSFDYHPNDEFGLESQSSHTPKYSWLLGYIKGLGYTKDQAKQLIKLAKKTTKAEKFNMCTIRWGLKPDGYEIMKTHKIGDTDIFEVELRGTRTAALMVHPSSGKEDPENKIFGIVLSRPSTRF